MQKAAAVDLLSEMLNSAAREADLTCHADICCMPPLTLSHFTHIV